MNKHLYSPMNSSFRKYNFFIWLCMLLSIIAFLIVSFPASTKAKEEFLTITNDHFSTFGISEGDILQLNEQFIQFIQQQLDSTNLSLEQSINIVQVHSQDKEYLILTYWHAQTDEMLGFIAYSLESKQVIYKYIGSYYSFITLLEQEYGKQYYWDLVNQETIFRLFCRNKYLSVPVHTLPSEVELTEDEAISCAKQYMILNNNFSKKQMDDYEYGRFFYKNPTTLSHFWTILIIDENSEIDFQLDIDAYSGAILSFYDLTL